MNWKKTALYPLLATHCEQEKKNYCVYDITVLDQEINVLVYKVEITVLKSPDNTNFYRKPYSHIYN